MDGVDEDDLVARQLGASSATDLSDVQEKYKDKIKAKLEARAEELQREREARAIKFSQGKAAYARGQYDASVVFLESALNEEGPFSQLGGDIQMWLALAYAATGRQQDCIDTYKAIERSHPIPGIRRKAADLRYIMEAPKLQLGEDEKVKIPVLTDVDSNRGGRGSAPMPRTRPGPRPQKPKTWDEEFWENYKPPQYLKNRYVWTAAAILLAGLAAFYSQGVGFHTF
jgi:tetratricopeptide (TPR) repeat protein